MLGAVGSESRMSITLHQETLYIFYLYQPVKYSFLWRELPPTAVRKQFCPLLHLTHQLCCWWDVQIDLWSNRCTAFWRCLKQNMTVCLSLSLWPPPSLPLRSVARWSRRHRHQRRVQVTWRLPAGLCRWLWQSALVHLPLLSTKGQSCSLAVAHSTSLSVWMSLKLALRCGGVDLFHFQSRAAALVFSANLVIKVLMNAVKTPWKLSRNNKILNHRASLWE